MATRNNLYLVSWKRSITTDRGKIDAASTVTNASQANSSLDQIQSQNNGTPTSTNAVLQASQSSATSLQSLFTPTGSRSASIEDEIALDIIE